MTIDHDREMRERKDSALLEDAAGVLRTVETEARAMFVRPSSIAILMAVLAHGLPRGVLRSMVRALLLHRRDGELNFTLAAKALEDGDRKLL